MMKKWITALFIVAISFGFILCGLSVVSAQPAEDDSNLFMLEEITVTAQKRAENQQKVPIAMDTISRESIDTLGLNDLDEIIGSLSPVFINEAGDGLRVSIRGMSDDVLPRGDMMNMSNSMPTVAVNMDGIFTAGRASGANLYDVERVEVLFGPQSTLYSSNSPGGIVNIVTGSPKIGEYEAAGKFEIGNYDTLQTEGVLNVPVTDTTALRVAFRTSSHEGYMANGSDDDDTKSGRIRALYAPSESFSFQVTGQYSLVQGVGFSGVKMFYDEGDLDDPWDNSYADDPIHKNRTTKDISTKLEWDLGFGALTMLASFSDMKETGSVIADDMYTGETLTTDYDNRQEEKGAELRVVSSEDFPFEWILGSNIYELSQTVLAVTREYGWNSGNTNDIESMAVYGNITYPVSDVFRVTGGLRYSDDTNDGLFMYSRFNVEVPSLNSYTGTDHKLGIEYDINENSMLYADWSTGYRVGSMGGSEGNPETLNAYTVGVKNRFLDNRLQLNWVAYYYDYKHYPADINLGDPLQGRKDEGSKTTGDMTMYGSDLQTEFILTPQDSLNLSVSYESAEFDYLFFDFESEALTDVSYAGKPLTFTPDWTINAAYSHDFSLPNGGSLTAKIDSRYQTSYYISFMDKTGVMIDGDNVTVSYIGYNKQEACHLSNLSMTYAHPDGKWTLAGYIKNLEDYAVKRNLVENDMMIGPPRTYGFVLSVRY